MLILIGTVYVYVYIYIHYVYIYIYYCVYIYIMCIIYIYMYIVDSCLLNHVMPAVPHRSLFVTLGRETLIRASAAALVLNFAGESPGGSGRASGRGPKIADLYGIYMDFLWEYPILSHLLIFCCRLEVYTHGK